MRHTVVSDTCIPIREQNRDSVVTPVLMFDLMTSSKGGHRIVGSCPGGSQYPIIVPHRHRIGNRSRQDWPQLL